MPAPTFDEHVGIVAAESPRGLVLDWWCRLDMTLDCFFDRRGMSRPRSPAGMELAFAADDGLPMRFATEIHGLRLERNRIAHQRGPCPTSDEASDYARRAFAAIGVLLATR